MFSLLELALNNDYIYLGIIGVLIVIIILTILSIKKDRDKAIKARSYVKPVVTEEEKEQAKLELEKVVDEMQKNLDNEKVTTSDITTYEEEQESKAIISYQELVEAVRNNNETKVHNEVGMEVADTNAIEKPEEVVPPVEKTDEVTIDSIINQVYKEDTKPYSEENFQTSEVISPIYGMANEVDDKPIYNDLDSDMEEVDEFLDSLKDFRKNL
jgi:hypothetical protein